MKFEGAGKAVGNKSTSLVLEGGVEPPRYQVARDFESINRRLAPRYTSARRVEKRQFLRGCAHAVTMHGGEPEYTKIKN